MQVEINLSAETLAELGITVDQFQQAANTALSSLVHPETGEPIYFNGISVSVSAADSNEESGHTHDEPSEDEIAEWREQSHEEAARNFRIHHHYDIGNQDVYVERHEGVVDGKRAAIYCQFQCEEWFGHDAMLSNLGVGTLLCMFYGFRHRAVAVLESATEIDMYSDREKACGGLAFELLADPSLHRPGMREVMEKLVERV